MGKRIMNLANKLTNVFMVGGVILGLICVVAAFAVFGDSDVMIIIMITAGILVFLTGWWVSEVVMSVIFGLGVIVDRMEHLNPEYFDDRALKQPNTTARPAQSSNQKAAYPRVTVNDQKEWKCPECSRVNHGFSQECMSCFTPRPKEK